MPANLDGEPVRTAGGSINNGVRCCYLECYRLHNELKEHYREDLKALVTKQLQEKAKHRHNAAMELEAQDGQQTDADANKYAATMRMNSPVSDSSINLRRQHTPGEDKSGGPRLHASTHVLPVRGLWRLITRAVLSHATSGSPCGLLARSTRAQNAPACTTPRALEAVLHYIGYADCGTRRSNPTAVASGGRDEQEDLGRYTRQRTAQLYQAKVREIQEAAQDAALQDETLRLKEEHLQQLLDTLQEFASVKDSPARGLLEHARQV